MVDTAEATRRLNVKKQTLDDAYAAPANFLEIDILNPITHGVAKKRYTDYEVRMRVSYFVRSYAYYNYAPSVGLNVYLIMSVQLFADKLASI